MGSTLASYFSVFHRLLAARLRAALSGMTAGRAAGAAGDGATTATAALHRSVSPSPLVAGAAAAAAAAGGRGSEEPRGSASPSPPPGGAAQPGAPGGAAGTSLPALAKELAESCAGAAHTYLHAQQLLGALARHPRGAAFVRLSQELEGATAKAHAAAWATQVRGRAQMVWRWRLHVLSCVWMRTCAR